APELSGADRPDGRQGLLDVAQGQDPRVHVVRRHPARSETQGRRLMSRWIRPSEHRLAAPAELSFVQPPLDAALAIVQLPPYVSIHSKSLLASGFKEMLTHS